VGHVADWWLLDDIKWSGFEKKLMGNFSSIAGDPNPKKLIRRIHGL
jgi:hypothetical protein